MYVLMLRILLFSCGCVHDLSSVGRLSINALQCFICLECAGLAGLVCVFFDHSSSHTHPFFRYFEANRIKNKGLQCKTKL